MRGVPAGELASLLAGLRGSDRVLAGRGEEVEGEAGCGEVNEGGNAVESAKRVGEPLACVARPGSRHLTRPSTLLRRRSRAPRCTARASAICELRETLHCRLEPRLANYWVSSDRLIRRADAAGVIRPVVLRHAVGGCMRRAPGVRSVVFQLPPASRPPPPFNLASLAFSVAISPSHFCILSSASFGFSLPSLSPSSFLIIPTLPSVARSNKAYLAESSLSVHFACGCDSVSGSGLLSFGPPIAKPERSSRGTVRPPSVMRRATRPASVCFQRSQLEFAEARAGRFQLPIGAARS